MSDLPSSELQANIRKALLSGIAPMTRQALAKALPVGGRPGPKALKAQLDAMVAAGQLVCIPSKMPKFTCAPIEEWVQAAWLQLLSKGPQPQVKLRKVLPQSFEATLDRVLEEMLSKRKIFLHPPPTKARKPLYALEPADPATYLAKNLEKLLAATVQLGFSTNAVREAAIRYLGAQARQAKAKSAGASETAAALQDEILQAMRRIEPRVDLGAAVSIARLRQSVSRVMDKPTFDVSVLDLAKGGVLELQSHAWPARLTPDEQDELIDNGRGGWFDSAALRR